MLCPINIDDEEDTEDVCGWRFYSDKYVDNLCNVINNPKNLILYKNIKELDIRRRKECFKKMKIIQK